jgi:hypothetical protein
MNGQGGFFLKKTIKLINSNNNKKRYTGGITKNVLAI